MNIDTTPERSGVDAVLNAADKVAAATAGARSTWTARCSCGAVLDIQRADITLAGAEMIAASQAVEKLLGAHSISLLHHVVTAVQNAINHERAKQYAHAFAAFCSEHAHCAVTELGETHLMDAKYILSILNSSPAIGAGGGAPGAVETATTPAPAPTPPTLDHEHRVVQVSRSLPVTAEGLRFQIISDVLFAADRIDSIDRALALDPNDRTVHTCCCGWSALVPHPLTPADQRTVDEFERRHADCEPR